MACESSVLERSRAKLRQIVEVNKLHDVNVSVLVKTLTPEEAIGRPGRRDFPIIVGKERVVEARIHDSAAHAFTDSPGEFIGKLNEILELPLKHNKERAVYIAALNAVLKHLDLVDKILHCRDEDPEECAAEIAAHIRGKWGEVGVGLIGLNPAIAEGLVETFGSDKVRITDLNKDNIDTVKFGVKVWSGDTMAEKLIEGADVVVITGTTIVNGTLDKILDYVESYQRGYLIYGVTCAGVCRLLNLSRICTRGRD